MSRFVFHFSPSGVESGAISGDMVRETFNEYSSEGPLYIVKKDGYKIEINPVGNIRLVLDNRLSEFSSLVDAYELAAPQVDKILSRTNVKYRVSLIISGEDPRSDYLENESDVRTFVDCKFGSNDIPFEQMGQKKIKLSLTAGTDKAVV